MGYRPEPTVYKLTFEGSDFDGLTAEMSSLSVSEYNAMLRLALGTGFSEETLKSNDKMLDLFAKHLLKWNLEDQDGKPVPATKKGVESQETRLISKVMTAWQIALVKIPDELGKDSPSGNHAPEQSLDLAKLSKSL